MHSIDVFELTPFQLQPGDAMFEAAEGHPIFPRWMVIILFFSSF